MEECGHVPHLEQPDVTADAIATFISSRVKTSNEADSNDSPVPTYVVGAGVAGALAASQIFQLLLSQ